jgi:hypothetical protein
LQWRRPNLLNGIGSKQAVRHQSPHRPGASVVDRARHIRQAASGEDDVVGDDHVAIANLAQQRGDFRPLVVKGAHFVANRHAGAELRQSALVVAR